MVYPSIDNVLLKHPNRSPVIVTLNDRLYKTLQKNNLNGLKQQQKYLVPNEMTIGQFSHIVRKRIMLSESQGMFLFINNNLPPTSETISNLYQSYKNDDLIMYIDINIENTFG